MKLDHDEWARENQMSAEQQASDKPAQGASMTVSMPGESATQGQKGARFPEESTAVWKIGAGCAILLMPLFGQPPFTVAHQRLEQCLDAQGLCVADRSFCQEHEAVHGEGALGASDMNLWFVSTRQALIHASCKDHARSK